MTEQKKSFVEPLRMHFWRSKSTLDSLKSVFNVFWIKPSLGALDSTSLKRQIAHSDWPTLKLFCFLFIPRNYKKLKL